MVSVVLNTIFSFLLIWFHSSLVLHKFYDRICLINIYCYHKNKMSVKQLGKQGGLPCGQKMEGCHAKRKRERASVGFAAAGYTVCFAALDCEDAAGG